MVEVQPFQEGLRYSCGRWGPLMPSPGILRTRKELLFDEGGWQTSSLHAVDAAAGE